MNGERVVYLLAAAAVAVPVVTAYLGVKSTVRIVLAGRRGLLRRHLLENRRYYLLLGGANAVLGILFLYGWLIETQRVELVRQSVTVHPHTAPVALTIAHLSDLHIHTFGAREKKALELVAASEPDLICLTGDYASDLTPRAFAATRRFLGELSAPYGVFASLGNWDLNPAAIFDGSHVQLLADRAATVEIRGAEVRLTGIRFGLSPLRLDKPPPQALNILLHHSPDYLEEASQQGYDLYLAGHTHGGQVRLPGLGPIVRMSRRGYDMGLYGVGDTWMYVNRGLGAEAGPLPEIRLFCRPEVTVIELNCRPREP
jgi:predicted MPP superfamily phosphohydrolase